MYVIDLLDCEVDVHELASFLDDYEANNGVEFVLRRAKDFGNSRSIQSKSSSAFFTFYRRGKGGCDKKTTTFAVGAMADNVGVRILTWCCWCRRGRTT
jgi:hypothetical protein